MIMAIPHFKYGLHNVYITIFYFSIYIYMLISHFKYVLFRLVSWRWSLLPLIFNYVMI